MRKQVATPAFDSSRSKIVNRLVSATLSDTLVVASFLGTVDEAHRKIIREVLEAYHLPTCVITQVLEGNDIVGFSAALGHIYAARIVCYKVNNTLFPLFFDTNHHIYLNEKYVKESLFYEECPMYQNSQCTYMPAECYAVGYLDEDRLNESYGYTFPP